MNSLKAMTPLIAAGVALSLLPLFQGCATPPPPRKITVSERIQFDRAIGSELAQQLEPQLIFRKDAAVQDYLDRVAQKLADKTPELHIPEVRVLLLQDRSKKWSSYSLPGGRVYVSIGLLKKLQFDNEVAALVAIELARLMKEHVLEYLRKLPAADQTEELEEVETLQAPGDLEFFGENGVFSFNEKEELDVIDLAVDILYSGGYDSRGALTLLRVMQNNASHSPYAPELLAKLIERARRRMVLRAPLRNPIVRTDDFLFVRPRIEKL